MLSCALRCGHWTKDRSSHCSALPCGCRRRQHIGTHYRDSGTMAGGSLAHVPGQIAPQQDATRAHHSGRQPPGALHQVLSACSPATGPRPAAASAMPGHRGLTAAIVHHEQLMGHRLDGSCQQGWAEVSFAEAAHRAVEGMRCGMEAAVQLVGWLPTAGRRVKRRSYLGPHRPAKPCCRRQRRCLWPQPAAGAALSRAPRKRQALPPRWGSAAGTAGTRSTPSGCCRSAEQHRPHRLELSATCVWSPPAIPWCRASIWDPRTVVHGKFTGVLLAPDVR